MMKESVQEFRIPSAKSARQTSFLTVFSTSCDEFLVPVFGLEEIEQLFARVQKQLHQLNQSRPEGVVLSHDWLFHTLLGQLDVVQKEWKLERKDERSENVFMGEVFGFVERLMNLHKALVNYAIWAPRDASGKFATHASELLAPLRERLIAKAEQYINDRASRTGLGQYDHDSYKPYRAGTPHDPVTLFRYKWEQEVKNRKWDGFDNAWKVYTVMLYVMMYPDYTLRQILEKQGIRHHRRISHSASEPAHFPELIVLDLDFTVWPFWSDTQVSAPFKRSGTENLIYDKFDTPVSLFEELPEVLRYLKQRGVKVAIASSTIAGHVSEAILEQIQIRETRTQAMVPALDFFEHDWSQMYSASSKQVHLAKIHEMSGVPYNEIIFFDDEAKNMKTSHLVFSALCNNGLTLKFLKDTIQAWNRSKRSTQMAYLEE